MCSGLNFDFLKAGLRLKLKARMKKEEEGEDVHGAEPETACQLMCSQSSTKTHGHDDRRRVPSPSLHPPPLLGHLLWPKWPQQPYYSTGSGGADGIPTIGWIRPAGLLLSLHLGIS